MSPGVTGRAEIMDAVHPGGLGGTFGGNPVACAAALAVLDVVSDRSFREMVKDVFLSHEAWTAPAIEIAAPFSAFGENELRAVRQLHRATR